jgi:hypothetical protein
MPTDQELTIIDVIHAAINRLPVSMAITITSGIYVELCSESGISKQSAVELLNERYDEYLVEID